MLKMRLPWIRPWGSQVQDKVFLKEVLYGQGLSGGLERRPKWPGEVVAPAALDIRCCSWARAVWAVLGSREGNGWREGVWGGHAGGKCLT